VAVGVIVALGSGGSDSPSNPSAGKQGAAPVTSVPRSSDPAEQARELADFLRAQARAGQTTAPP
jgi:hypothetical protein